MLAGKEGKYQKSNYAPWESRQCSFRQLKASWRQGRRRLLQRADWGEPASRFPMEEMIGRDKKCLSRAAVDLDGIHTTAHTAFTIGCFSLRTEAVRDICMTGRPVELLTARSSLYDAITAIEQGRAADY